MDHAPASSRKATVRTLAGAALGLVVLMGGLILSNFYPGLFPMKSGKSIMVLVTFVAGVWTFASIMNMATLWYFRRQGRPESEGHMIARLYRMASVVVIVFIIASEYDKLGTFSTLFSMFGGMVIGWSLQSPISGFAAWLLVSIKRPFRPGDRVQFPNLGLTGDIVNIGPMYVVLDQVGGTVGSEEAVGRYILVPNAMLFSQVVINFTVRQEAAYMLDEVVVRITYDSDMELAEKILLSAADHVTHDIIVATGQKPYIRSDLYDYGLYMRLRYQTGVGDRARIAYELTKQIIRDIQRTPSVDLAIPYIYSYRAGLDRKEEGAAEPDAAEPVRHIEVARIRHLVTDLDGVDIEQIKQSVAEKGLLQPIIVTPAPDGVHFDVEAGRLRLEACKRLGWRTIPAIIQLPRSQGPGPASFTKPA